MSPADRSATDRIATTWLSVLPAGSAICAPCGRASPPGVAQAGSVNSHGGVGCLPWGFTNLGRFAAAYAARYRETPTETLRRGSFRRSATKLPGRARTVRR